MGGGSSGPAAVEGHRQRHLPELVAGRTVDLFRYARDRKIPDLEGDVLQSLYFGAGDEERRLYRNRVARWSIRLLRQRRCLDELMEGACGGRRGNTSGRFSEQQRQF